jgi:hypothetical protein
MSTSLLGVEIEDVRMRRPIVSSSPEQLTETIFGEHVTFDEKISDH